MASDRAAKRLEWLDLARGIALIAMTIYHFTWDLGMFGYIDPATATSGGWRIFARVIATSFLAIVGISVVLAVQRSQETIPRGYARRTVRIAAAAALITVATWFATPDAFIFFGILHHIVVASILALLVVRWPVWSLVALALVASVGLSQIDLVAFNSRWLAWTGLFANPPRSNDFVPLVPFVGAVFAGMAAGRLLGTKRLAGSLAGARALHPLRFIGRHSLVYYLVHQPVLIAFIWVATQIVPPPSRTYSNTLISACIAQCIESRTGAYCETFCNCANDVMLSQPALEPDTVAGMCDARIEPGSDFSD